MSTGAEIWRRRKRLWPVRLLASYLRCRTAGMPRGLMVEPTEKCTGTCSGCGRPDEAAVLGPEQLENWLALCPAGPVTIHFSGRHSDPLASPLLAELSHTALDHCSMLSVSTIGLGFSPKLSSLPVDRWIVSLPAAAEDSWRALRGDGRFNEALNAIASIRELTAAMVEVVLTIWRPSQDDEPHFRELCRKHGWDRTRTVFGRFDPTGHHVGRVENLAMDHPRCPYQPGKQGIPSLRHEPEGCPLLNCLFLDAKGTLHPCPFTGEDAPALPEPSPEAWKQAAAWSVKKRKRSFRACRWCP